MINSRIYSTLISVHYYYVRLVCVSEGTTSDLFDSPSYLRPVTSRLTVKVPEKVQKTEFFTR